MADPASRPAPGARRWLAIALFVSLALNFAGLGLALGFVFAGGPRGPGADVGLSRYGAAMPEPFRRDLARELGEGRRDWGEMRRRLRGQRAALAAALTAEPFDIAAVADLLDGERALVAGLAERGNALLIAQIARMDPEARRAYAAALLEPRRGSPRDRR